MSQIHTYPVPADIARHAFINAEMYREMYLASVEDPEAFWAEQGQIISWITPIAGLRIPPSIQAISISVGLRMAPSTWRPTAWIAIWPNAANRRPSSGRATIRRRAAE